MTQQTQDALTKDGWSFASGMKGHENLIQFTQEHQQNGSLIIYMTGKLLQSIETEYQHR